MSISSNHISKKNKIIHQRIFYYALVLIAVTLPFSLLANSISMIILLVNWLIEGNFSEKIISAKNNKLLWLFLFFYLLHLAGMAYTTNIHNGLFELQKKLPLFVLPLIIATSNKLNPIQIKGILKFFIFSILAASFICIGYAFYRNAIDTSPDTDWLYFSYRDLTEIIHIQATYLALYVGFAVLSLCLFFKENFTHYSRVKKGGFFFLILYLIVFLFLLSSRTEIAAFIVIFFSGIIYFYYLNKKLLKGFLILGIISVSLTALLSQLPVVKERFMLAFGIEHKDKWINQYGDGKGVQPDVRPLKWKCAWSIIKENLFLGVGTGDVQDALQIQYKRIDFQVAYKQEFNAHNQFLETWLGLGVIGLFSFLFCLVAPFIIAFRQKNYLFISFMILFFVCCLTESILCRQQGIVFYILFSTLLSFNSYGKTT